MQLDVLDAEIQRISANKWSEVCRLAAAVARMSKQAPPRQA
jgi:hypothetical protein